MSKKIVIFLKNVLNVTAALEKELKFEKTEPSICVE